MTSPHPPASNGGFTMVEVLIAAVLLVVALVGSLALTFALVRGNQSTRGRDTGFYLAQEVLDQLATKPFSALSAGLAAGVGTITLPVCYAQADDAFIDHPLPFSLCGSATAPAAYYVRSWVCCATPGAALGAGACDNSLPIQTSSTVGDGGQSCLVQVEVTWPFEPAALASAPAGLFVDSPAGVPVQNHIWLTTERAQ